MERQKITGLIFEAVSVFRGKYPDVAIADGINYDDLIKGDENPFFVTLQIGAVNAVSRNNRRYKSDSSKAIVSAINSGALGGDQGHLTQEERSFRFNTPVVEWVGATIDESGTIWGKLYVPKTEPKMREHFRIRMAKNAEVGTSLYGTAYLEEDEETGIPNVVDLTVEQIDIVHAMRRGVEQAGGVPLVTTETHDNEISEADDMPITVGDYVTWEFGTTLRRGQVNTVWTSGEVPTNSDAPKIIATKNEPFARMDVYWTHRNGWVMSDYQVIQPLGNLNKIEPLPQPLREATQEEMQQINQEVKEAMTMTDSKMNPVAQPDPVRVVELEGQIDDLKRNHTAEIKKLERKVNDLEKIATMLEAEDAYTGVTLLLNKVATLETENAALLESTIKQQVADAIAVESVRPVVESLVRSKTPTTRAEVEAAVKSIQESADIKPLLVARIQTESGPAVTNPGKQVATESQEAEEEKLWLPL